MNTIANKNDYDTVTSNKDQHSLRKMYRSKVNTD